MLSHYAWLVYYNSCKDCKPDLNHRFTCRNYFLSIWLLPNVRTDLKYGSNSHLLLYGITDGRLYFLRFSSVDKQCCIYSDSTLILFNRLRSKTYCEI